MWDDDPDDFDQPDDDGEAFNNTLVNVGENLIGELLKRRGAQLAHLSEQEFVRLFDMARTTVDDWLSPQNLTDIWNGALWRYHEHCKEAEPEITAKECEQLMQELLPQWYAIVHKEEERQREERKRNPPKKKRRKR